MLKFNDIHLLQLGHLQGFITIVSPKAINSTLTMQEIQRPTIYHNYCRTNTKKFLPFYQGPKFLNSLDNKVISSQSLSSFKKKLKIKLLSKYEINS